jgi:hypothetical protein
MRAVVMLKHSQSWTLPQIADRIRHSVPAVASLLRRGLEELRKRLKTAPQLSRRTSALAALDGGLNGQSKRSSVSE